jgi:hypothetical protein
MNAIEMAPTSSIHQRAQRKYIVLLQLAVWWSLLDTVGMILISAVQVVNERKWYPQW